MLGFVNQAIEDLVVDRFGPAAWGRILERADFTEFHFEPERSYPDALTTALWRGAVRELDLGADELLEVFGQCWPGYASLHGYAQLDGIECVGELLDRWDDVHELAAVHHLNLGLPHTDVRRTGDGWTIELNHDEARAGIDTMPLLRGVLRALADRCAQTVELTRIGKTKLRIGLVSDAVEA